jgi:predicted amidophosphoribosyltransferase
MNKWKILAFSLIVISLIWFLTGISFIFYSLTTKIDYLLPWIIVWGIPCFVLWYISYRFLKKSHSIVTPSFTKNNQTSKKPITTESIVEEVDVRKCARCGKNITEDSKFCQSCRQAILLEKMLSTEDKNKFHELESRITYYEVRRMRGIIASLLGGFWLLVLYIFGRFLPGQSVGYWFIFILLGLMYFFPSFLYSSLRIKQLKKKINKFSTLVNQPLKKEVTQLDRRCPDCDRIIPFDANICPYCARKFYKFQSNEVKGNCDSCGFEIQSCDIFCKNCGKKVTRSDKSNPNVKELENKDILGTKLSSNKVEKINFETLFKTGNIKVVAKKMHEINRDSILTKVSEFPPVFLTRKGLLLTGGTYETVTEQMTAIIVAQIKAGELYALSYQELPPNNSDRILITYGAKGIMDAVYMIREVFNHVGGKFVAGEKEERYLNRKQAKERDLRGII